MKILKLKDKYYEYDIWLIVGDELLFKKYIQKKYEVSVDGFEDVGTVGDAKTLTLEKDGQLHVIVWIRSFDWKVFEMGLLVHELLHVVHAVLKNVGFKFSDDSEEAYTYYLQALTQEAFWKLRTIKRKK